MTTKPDLTRVWAATADPGDIEDPDVTLPNKYTLGWLAEVPTHENFNFLQQQFSQGLAHANEQGVMVWDTDSTYPIHGLAKGSDGNVYRAIVAQSGNDPVGDGGTNWVIYADLSLYGAIKNYVVGNIVKGSDNDYYLCLIDNGPASSVEDPVGDLTSTWSFLFAPNVTTAISITVGVDFPTLEDCMDWVSKRRITDILGGVTIFLASGSNALGTYNFDHPDGNRIIIQGQTMLGAIPVADDMVGTFATDLTFIKTRWASWIDLTADIGSKFGLSVPSGLKLRDLVVIPATPYIAQNRYTISVGEFSSSWQTARGPSSVALDTFGVFGGTWGVVAVNANVTNVNDLFFAYQDDGAPFLLSGSRLQSDTFPTNRIECFSTAATAKYAIYAINGSQANLDNSLRVKGPFATAIFCRASLVSAVGSDIDGVETIITAERNSYVNIYNSDFDDCDTTPGLAQQEQWQGNSGVLRAQISIGQGCSVNYDSTEWNGCIGSHAILGGQADDCTGLSVLMDDCLWNTTLMTLTGCKGRISVAVTNPQGGSINQLTAVNGGYVYTQVSTGVTFSPPIGTQDANFSAVV